MIKQILTGVILAGCIGFGNASQIKGTRFHDEANDTIKLNAILADAKAHTGDAKPEARVAYIGKQFLGVPYVAGTLDQGEEAVSRRRAERISLAAALCKRMGYRQCPQRYTERGYRLPTL